MKIKVVESKPPVKYFKDLPEGAWFYYDAVGFGPNCIRRKDGDKACNPLGSFPMNNTGVLTCPVIEIQPINTLEFRVKK